MTLEDGRELKARAVIGADGVRSVIGRALDVPPPAYAGYIAYRHSTLSETGMRQRLSSLSEACKYVYGTQALSPFWSIWRIWAGMLVKQISAPGVAAFMLLTVGVITGVWRALTMGSLCPSRPFPWCLGRGVGERG